MKEKFPKLAKKIDIQIQEAQGAPNKLNPKRTTPRHIIIKMQRVKNKQNGDNQPSRCRVQNTGDQDAQRIH